MLSKVGICIIPFSLAFDDVKLTNDLMNLQILLRYGVL